MFKHVYKQKGSRVYRGRFRLGDDPEIHDVPLKTDKKEIAQKKLERLVLELEKEQLGMIDPSFSGFGEETDCGAPGGLRGAFGGAVSDAKAPGVHPKPHSEGL